MEVQERRATPSWILAAADPRWASRRFRAPLSGLSMEEHPQDRDPDRKRRMPPNGERRVRRVIPSQRRPLQRPSREGIRPRARAGYGPKREPRSGRAPLRRRENLRAARASPKVGERIKGSARTRWYILDNLDTWIPGTR